MICSAGADDDGCTALGDRRGLKGEDAGVAMMAELAGQPVWSFSSLVYAGCSATSKDADIG